jgi:hypothetical protein
MNIPGFTADATLLHTGNCLWILRSRPREAQLFGREADSSREKSVTPQFSHQALVCGALVVAILAGQEELWPLAIRYCGNLA